MIDLRLFPVDVMRLQSCGMCVLAVAFRPFLVTSRILMLSHSFPTFNRLVPDPMTQPADCSIFVLIKSYLFIGMCVCFLIKRTSKIPFPLDLNNIVYFKPRIDCLWHHFCGLFKIGTIIFGWL